MKLKVLFCVLSLNLFFIIYTKAQNVDLVNSPQSKVVLEFMKKSCYKTKQVIFIAPSTLATIKINPSDIKFNCFFSTKNQIYITEQNDDIVEAYFKVNNGKLIKFKFRVVKENDTFYIKPNKQNLVNKDDFLTAWIEEERLSLEDSNKLLENLGVLDTNKKEVVNKTSNFYDLSNIKYKHNYVGTGKSEVVHNFLKNLNNQKKIKEYGSSSFWKSIQKKHNISKENVTVNTPQDLENFITLFEDRNNVYAGIKPKNENWKILVFSVGGEHSAARISPFFKENSNKSIVEYFVESNDLNGLSIEKYILSRITAKEKNINPAYIKSNNLVEKQLDRMLLKEGFKKIHSVNNILNETNSIGNTKIIAKKGRSYVMLLISSFKEPIEPIAIVKVGEKSTNSSDFLSSYNLPSKMFERIAKLHKANYTAPRDMVFEVDVLTKKGNRHGIFVVYELDAAKTKKYTN